MAIKAFVLNYVSLFALLVLTADALDANWLAGPLYARVQLNLFYNVHAMSVLCIPLSAVWLWRKDSLPTAVFAALGIASIHEITLDLVDLGIWRESSGINPSYAAYLGAFLLVGWFITSKYHKKVWLVTTGMMVFWFVVVAGLQPGSTLSSTVPFGQSSQFYDPIANFAEVSSWIAPSALWFLPRRWFDHRLIPSEIYSVPVLGACVAYAFWDIKPFHDDKALQGLVRDASSTSKTFIETGTFKGATTKWVAKNFPSLKVITYESNFFVWLLAKLRVRESNVKLIRSDSRNLSTDTVEGPIIYWLDAHWTTDLPLKEEARAIRVSGKKSVVIIDDIGNTFEGKTLTMEYVRSLFPSGNYKYGEKEVEGGAWVAIYLP